MNILSCKNLSKIGREKVLFSGVTFGIEEGEKVALVGRNGCGKTTLLSVIAGLIPGDEGQAVISTNSGFSFLPQTPGFNPEDTIYQHIFKHPSQRLQTLRDYLSLCSKLEKELQVDRQKKLTAQLESLTEDMDKKNLWNYENEIESILSNLGIDDLDIKMKTLSGGTLKKVALAQVLIDDTKLLLLDEPTNHLDIETISWLENYLKETPKAVLMVTHDRYFLDNVCSGIYEINNGRLEHYKGNFSYYLEKKAEKEAQEEAADQKIESILRREREWLLRGPCARGTKIKARIDRDMALINREKPVKDLTFDFGVTGRRLGGKILEVKDLEKKFGNRTILKDFTYSFKKGEKIGIFGKNGAGKTTFLNLLTQSLAPDKGEITLGTNTFISYYMQNPVLSEEEKKAQEFNVIDYIKNEQEYSKDNTGRTLSASQILEKFGFTGKMLYSPVKALSGGEKKRLYLVKLLLKNPNFLILDEPTNDFDIYTMSVLESFLSEFQGCLLIVSHDRYFMDRTTDSLFILEQDGIVKGFTGSVSEYLDLQKIKKQEEAKQHQNKKTESTEKKEPPREKTKLTFKEQKEFEALEESISLKESEKKRLEELMASGETDHTKLAQWGTELTVITEELETAYARWEYLASF